MRRKVKHRRNLLPGHVELFHYFLDAQILKILNDCGDRQAGIAKYPCAAESLRHAFDGSTMDTTLRKVGGSIMLIVPPALLDMLQLRPGSKVGVAVHKGRLVVEPRLRPRYTLEELLAQCNRKARRTEEDQEWLGNKPAGRELV